MSDHSNPRQVFERVITLLKSGARAEAESLCRESIQRDPGDVNFMALLGTILAERNEWREAEECLRHAIRVAPGHARAHEDLGTVLLNQGVRVVADAGEVRASFPAVCRRQISSLRATRAGDSSSQPNGC